MSLNKTNKMGIWMNTYSVNFNIVDILIVILHVGWYLECDITCRCMLFVCVDSVSYQHTFVGSK